MKTSLLAAVLGAFAVGCSAEAAAPEPAADEQDMTKARVTSAYSDLGGDACVLLSSGDEHADSECKAIGSYSVFIHDRIWQGMTAGLAHGDSEEMPLSVAESLPLPERADGTFPFRSYGPKAEWRVPMNDHAAPFALGMRIIDEIEQSDGTTRKQHHLAVFKLNGEAPCLFALVEASVQSGTANQIARDQMDRAQTEECPALGEVEILEKP